MDKLNAEIEALGREILRLTEGEVGCTRGQGSAQLPHHPVTRNEVQCLLVAESLAGPHRDRELILTMNARQRGKRIW